MQFWQPWLKPIQTKVIWLLLEGKYLPEEYASIREELREWFMHEVNASTRNIEGE